jgi:hypothetical protein
MIDPALREEVQIDHVHNAALCREIGERLAIGLGNEPVGMPPHLMMLMNRLRDEPSNPVNAR